MRRLATALVLCSAAVVLSGCSFALGSRVESDSSDRLDRLEQRISNAERTLGLTVEEVR